MSGQGSGSARSFSSGNAPQVPQQPQPQPQPQLQPQPQQPSPTFNRGRALFARLQADEVQEYKKFRKLDDNQMICQLNALQHWMNLDGPQNQDERSLSELFL